MLRKSQDWHAAEGIEKSDHSKKVLICAKTRLSPCIRHVMISFMSNEKNKTAILVAASIIAAVRLAREPIQNTPKVQAAIGDSIQLATMLWSRISRNS